MNERLEYFTNDRFKVLKYLYDIKNPSGVIAITQAEVCKDTKINPTTMNGIFKQLKELELLEHGEGKLGRYIMTKKGIEIVEKLLSIN